MHRVPIDHAFVLETLARCAGERLKQFAEDLLDEIENVDVLENRTGLVMLPLRDTVKGTAFHLGEVLVAEARVQTLGCEGYGMRTGRDLQAALAMAIIDASWQAEHARTRIESFVAEQADQHVAEDRARLSDVEATRVKMETF